MVIVSVGESLHAGEKSAAVKREPIHMNSQADGLAPEPIDLAYEADLLGNIQQALAGLQGFDVMALELIQNADDAGAHRIVFDVRDDALILRKGRCWREPNGSAVP